MHDARVSAVKHALTDVRLLVERLGLVGGKGSVQRQSGGVLICCPAHQEKRPSCSVQLKQGVVLWKCWGCGAKGDVLDLVAHARGLNMDSEFREVLSEAEALTGHHGSSESQRRVLAPATAQQSVPRTYPSGVEVRRLLESTVAVASDAEVASWIRSRGLSPDKVEGTEQVFALPKDATGLPRWAFYRGSPWSETGHRLLVAMRDVSGEIRSVRACRVTAADSPKRLPPGGHIATGLVMACTLGVAMLRGTFRPRRVIIAEGEPDWLVLASGSCDAAARLGIISGSWSIDMARRIPDGAEVCIWSDNDSAGDRYAKQIEDTLYTRCTLYRKPA